MTGVKEGNGPWEKNYSGDGPNGTEVPSCGELLKKRPG